MFLKSSNSTAISYKEKKISYQELMNHAAYYSSLISAQESKNIAIFSPNRPEWIYSFYGAWDSKSTVVPIDFMAKPEELAYILNDSESKIIFYADETSEVLNEALPLLNFQPVLYNFDKIQEPEHETNSDISIEGQKDETAVIIYTSGTTGSPKGVMLSFDNLMANVEAVAQIIPIFTADRPVMVLLPLHHIFPLLGTIVAPLQAGALIALTPSMKSDAILKTLQENKIAITIGVPRLYEAILKGIMTKINANKVAKVLYKVAKTVNSRSFSQKIFKKVHDSLGGNIMYMVCGGAKLNEDIAIAYKTLGFEMLEGFGMTEAAPMITFTRPNRWKIGSAGEPMPCTELKFEDGEVLARGRNIMKGYYNRPEETAVTLRDGWLHTGDLGHLDKEGFIHITGRSKDIIVLSNGKNINPEEIEFKLLSLSEYILEIAVFEKNDTLQCVIYPDIKKMNEANIKDIENTFNQHLIQIYNSAVSAYKRISKFYIIKEELPKTRLGKVQRFKLLELLEPDNKRKRLKDEPKFEEYVVIKDYLIENNRKSVLPDDDFELDLALDSLEKVNFMVFLEKTFGLKLDENVFSLHPTVEKMAKYMSEAKNKFQVETVRWSEILKEKVDHTLPKSWFTHNLFKNVSKAFFKVYFDIQATGLENLPKAPFILAPNHQTFFDGLFVSMYLNKHMLKNTYFYAKAKHVQNKFVRALANRNNVIIMDINKDLKVSMQKLAAVLAMNKNVILFPEGTRTEDGSLGEFKKFFAILSLECKTPIVPVSIVGAHKALPKGSLIPRPLKKITVHFHPAVFPEGHTYDSLTEAVYKELAEAVK